MFEAVERNLRGARQAEHTRLTLRTAQQDKPLIPGTAKRNCEDNLKLQRKLKGID
jgi:hypothetical protein